MSDLNPPQPGSINNSSVIETRSGPFGRWYARTEDGLQYTRKTNETGWTLTAGEDAQLAVPTDRHPLQLLLNIEHQAADQPDHWSLFLAREGYKGNVYQVTGDAEAMHYAFIADTNPATDCDAFKTAFVMAEGVTSEQETKVVEIVRSVKPPSAPNAAAVKENCQTWCVQVLVQLMKQGIVERKKVVEATGMMGLVRGKVKPVVDLT